MYNIGITLSKADPVGLNTLKKFVEMGFNEINQNTLKLDNVYLRIVESQIVPSEKYNTPKEPNPYPLDYDAFGEKYDLKYIIVSSRHRSNSGKPCLTVHASGNFGKAMYGGRNRELQRVIANPMRNTFLELQKTPPKKFEVSLEATHHSPTRFKIPMFFAELGSGKRQWMDEAACEYLANALMKGSSSQTKAPVAIGFGGGHYCPTFTVLEKDKAFGHICPKYAIDLLEKDLFKQMIERTVDGVDLAILDKGLKGFQRKKIEVALRNFDVETV